MASGGPKNVESLKAGMLNPWQRALAGKTAAGSPKGRDKWERISQMRTAKIQGPPSIWGRFNILSYFDRINKILHNRSVAKNDCRRQPERVSPANQLTGMTGLSRSEIGSQFGASDIGSLPSKIADASDKVCGGSMKMLKSEN